MSLPSISSFVRIWPWYALSLIVVVLDLFTKKLASDNLVMYERVQVLPIFDITLRHNYGAAFSFLADGGGWQTWFLGGLAAVVSVVLFVWMSRVPRHKILEILGLALVLGGALGNLYDRVTLGYVVDFILVYYNDAEFPAFNIADSAICCGAGLLILDAFVNRDEVNENSSNGSQTDQVSNPKS